jgi:hypothetical protein
VIVGYLEADTMMWNFSRRGGVQRCSEMDCGDFFAEVMLDQMRVDEDQWLWCVCVWKTEDVVEAGKSSLQITSLGDPFS